MPSMTFLFGACTPDTVVRAVGFSAVAAEVLGFGATVVGGFGAMVDRPPGKSDGLGLTTGGCGTGAGRGCVGLGMGFGATVVGTPGCLGGSGGGTNF